MKKRMMPQELAYVIGLAALALGGALMAQADFGVSMVVAPAYVIHLKVSQTLHWFTFGMAAYAIEALLLLALGLVLRRFRIGYLMSFVTAFLYGQLLDLFMLLTSFIAGAGMAGRCAAYVLGMVFCALGVANMFRTYLAPEAYEMVVKELSERYGRPIGRTKTVYDCISCLVAVLLSLAFFGRFEGVKWGTVVCALVNGSIIGLIGQGLDRAFEFRRMIGNK